MIGDVAEETKPKVSAHALDLGRTFVGRLRNDGVEYELALECFKHLFATAVLEETKGNKVEAARRMNLNRNTVRDFARWTP